MRHDWFTLIAIILIFVIAVWSYMTVDSRITDAVEDCNEHWRSQIEKTCPALIMGNLYGTEFMINDTLT